MRDDIIGVLPATADEILSAFPKVHPDPLLRRLRRLEKAYCIRKMKDGRYEVAPQPHDKEYIKSERVGGRFKAGQATCVTCGTLYTNIKKHFGNTTSRRCLKCKADDRPIRPKSGERRCSGCGRIKHVHHFYRKRGGLTKTCDTCRDYDVKRKRQATA